MTYNVFSGTLSLYTTTVTRIDTSHVVQSNFTLVSRSSTI